MFREQRRYGHDPATVVRAANATFHAPVRARAWRELPAGAHVFTCSWSDWFHETADPWRDEAWDVIRQRPDLTWQILTKRPERITDHLPTDWHDGWPHVWLGVSIENRRHVHRVDQLIEVAASVRFVSAEPLLGPLLADGCSFADGRYDWSDGYYGPQLQLAGIDWLIIGGESGPSARCLDERWVRDLIAVAREHEVAVHVKQLGTRWAREHGVGGKADRADVWPLDLRLRELPAGAGVNGTVIKHAQRPLTIASEVLA